GDLAVAQARRERGVRVDGGAVDLEARLGDALLVLVEGRGELLLHRLAQLLAEGTELAGEDDGRIPGGLNGLQAALEELLARRGIGELAALGDLPGERLRA